MIPSYQKFYKTVLNILSDGNCHKMKDIVDKSANIHDLTEEDKNTTYDKSKANVLYSRVHWVLTYLGKAGLIERKDAGVFNITDEGKKCLNKDIDNNFLRQYQSFIEFTTLSKKDVSTLSDQNQVSDQTPEDRINEAFKELNEQLISELIVRLKGIDSYEFEKLVNELLSRMGYGFPKTTSKTNDGGIDGIIVNDKLGFDAIFVQAKKWDENSVGSVEIDRFAGAMDKSEFSSTKGVFITTSTFSDSAKKAVNDNKNKQIILIDGRKLAEYMIEYNMGVSMQQEYIIKRIDNDFFEEI